MLPPPPPTRKTRKFGPPPPPRKTGATTPTVDADAMPPPISPDLARIDLEAAICVHGGYPQIPWKIAFRVLLAKCKATCFQQISAAAIWLLDTATDKQPPYYLDDFAPEMRKRFPYLESKYATRPHRPKTPEQLAAEREDARNAARIALSVANGTF